MSPSAFSLSGTIEQKIYREGKPKRRRENTACKSLALHITDLAWTPGTTYGP